MEARKVVGFLRGRGRNNKSIVLKVSKFLKKSIYIPKIKPTRLNPHRRHKLRGAAADNYNYRFLEEYELSPRRAPLVRFKSRSMILLSGCWGRMKLMGDHEVLDFEAPADHHDIEDDEFAGKSWNLLRQLEPTAEYDSVDCRAEWFIAKFYQELRMEKNIT